MSTKRNRQNYTKEFIQDAVNLVIEQGYGCNEVARRLGINRSNVTRWVREHRQDAEQAANGRRAARAMRDHIENVGRSLTGLEKAYRRQKGLG